jgi:hypothetical protein
LFPKRLAFSVKDEDIAFDFLVPGLAVFQARRVVLEALPLPLETRLL